MVGRIRVTPYNGFKKAQVESFADVPAQVVHDQVFSFQLEAACGVVDIPQEAYLVEVLQVPESDRGTGIGERFGIVREEERTMAFSQELFFIACFEAE